MVQLMCGAFGAGLAWVVVNLSDTPDPATARLLFALFAALAAVGWFTASRAVGPRVTATAPLGHGSVTPDPPACQASYRSVVSPQTSPGLGNAMSPEHHSVHCHVDRRRGLGSAAMALSPAGRNGRLCVRSGFWPGVVGPVPNRRGRSRAGGGGGRGRAQARRRTGRRHGRGPDGAARPIPAGAVIPALIGAAAVPLGALPAAVPPIPAVVPPVPAAVPPVPLGVPPVPVGVPRFRWAFRQSRSALRWRRALPISAAAAGVLVPAGLPIADYGRRRRQGRADRAAAARRAAAGRADHPGPAPAS